MSEVLTYKFSKIADDRNNPQEPANPPAANTLTPKAQQGGNAYDYMLNQITPIFTDYGKAADKSKYVMNGDHKFAWGSHLILYAADPKYRKFINPHLSKFAYNVVSNSTVPVDIENFKRFIGANQSTAASANNTDFFESLKQRGATPVIKGHTDAFTSGIWKGMWEHKPFLNNWKPWVKYASEQGAFPFSSAIGKLVDGKPFSEVIGNLADGNPLRKLWIDRSKSNQSTNPTNPTNSSTSSNQSDNPSIYDDLGNMINTGSSNPNIPQKDERSAADIKAAYESAYASKIQPGLSVMDRVFKAYMQGDNVVLNQDDITAMQQLTMFYRAATIDDPRVADYIQTLMGGTISPYINKNTTPAQLKDISPVFKEMMDVVFPSSEGTSGSSWMDGVIEANKPVIEDGFTKGITGGVKQGISQHKPYLYGNYQEWADYAVDQGMLPDWLKPFTKDKFTFWASLLGIGSLAIGGLTGVVRSFLGGDEEEEGPMRNMPNRQSQYNRLLNSTSMWRSM